MVSDSVNPKASEKLPERTEMTFRLFMPVKILSLLIRRHPVITANSNASFVFRADSKSERINETISS